MFESELAQKSKPILWVSFVFGLILSWSVLSGDHLGRVNLLYLIILYVVFPFLSLLFSIVSYFYSPFQFKSITSLIIKLIQNNRFIFLEYKPTYLKLQQSHSPKLIYLYFSQLATISFSLASLIVLFILLLTTDMHFIWRSTILNAEHIMSTLNIIALPWFFWNEAQPTLDLILNSQDDRLNNNGFALVTSSWWKFVVATQLFYALFMRVFFLLILSIVIKAKNKISVSGNNGKELDSEQTSLISLKDIQIQRDISTEYALNNWAKFSQKLIDEINQHLTGDCINQLNSGPEATESEQLIAERWRATQVILVKSWEPPLAELSDYMQNSNGFILPLDSNSETVQPIQEKHLKEWIRFVKQMPEWELLQIDKFNEKVVSQIPKGL